MVKAEQISVAVVERRDDPGVWSVEAINTDGSIEVALFPGPNSKDRATEYAAWRYELAEAADTITALRAEVEQHQKSFDVRWEASMRAIKRWQEAHPGNDLNWPDHADLVVWLLERDAALRAQNERLRAALWGIHAVCNNWDCFVWMLPIRRIKRIASAALKEMT